MYVITDQSPKSVLIASVRDIENWKCTHRGELNQCAEELCDQAYGLRVNTAVDKTEEPGGLPH